MLRLSLKQRSSLASFLVVLLFVPLTALTLEKAFVNSLTQSMYEQLHIQDLGLISEFELHNGEIHMPEHLFNEQFNIPDSGTYGFIAMHLVPAWQSSSAASWQAPPALARPAVGQELTSVITVQGKEYFQYSYTAQFEDNNQLFPVTFHILQDKHIFNQEVSEFRHTLWYWLGLITLLLVISMQFILSKALKPIKQLISQIQQVEKGQAEKLESHYPLELEHLKTNINHLIDAENRQRERFRHSLSDLAHSLKTPLAVLKAMKNLPEDAYPPLEQIQGLIERQLKRAVGGKGSGWNKAIQIAPLLNQLCQAMEKVYKAKQLNLHIEGPDNLTFKGDKGDFMELLGNVLDNGCKAANHQLQVTMQQQQNSLIINVDDDGPGIASADRERLLARGQRLDTYGEGHGIGMAIVSDLLNAYDGQLAISDSPLGGARITLTLPDASVSTGD